MRVKVTLWIDDDTVERARNAALVKGLSLSGIVECGLARQLAILETEHGCRFPQRQVRRLPDGRMPKTGRRAQMT
jgi:hypothetical protein